MDADNKYGNYEIHNYLLPIMCDIDKTCRKNGIKYTLSDGTLLGAVRHGGFIPWDDDIDISLDRNNYAKFVSVFDKELSKQYTFVYDIWVRRISRKDNPGKDIFPPTGCIDLFVFDNVPDNKLKERIQVLLLKVLQGMMKTNVFYNGFSFLNKVKLFVTHSLGKLIRQKTKQHCYELISQWANKEKTKYIARYNGPYKWLSNIRFSPDIIIGYQDIQFEGCSFMAMTGWDEYLTELYGNYMKLPDEKDRSTTHIHIE